MLRGFTQDLRQFPKGGVLFSVTRVYSEMKPSV